MGGTPARAWRLAPVLRERVCGRRLYSWRRLPEVPGELQLPGHARLDHSVWLQAHRSRVPRSSRVQAARRLLGHRRMASRAAGGLLWDRDGADLRRRPGELRILAAVLELDARV